MAKTVEEEAAFPVAEAHPREARRQAVTLEAFPEEVFPEEVHQEEEVHQAAAHQAAAHQAAHLEEDLPAHFREGEAHETIGQTSSYWRNPDRMAEA